jgi:hypothetical protein
MNYTNRDFGINLIRARKNHCCYPYPIQYEIVEGVDIVTLVFKEDKSPCLEPIKKAAAKLERMGCRAISAECGYFSYFQKEITASVDLPVFMSSLLQVPLAQQVIGPDKVVGIYVGTKSAVHNEHLASVGIQLGSNYVIEGASDNDVCREFINLWIEGKRPERPQAYYDKAANEFISHGVNFFKQNPNMGAMVLECTGFPPFARQLQREIDIPVFSYSTLHDYAYSVAVHRDFYGHV